MHILLNWANDPSVRMYCFDPSPIEPFQHYKWFNSGLLDPDRLHYILLDSKKIPIGQIRFDIDRQSNYIFVDFSLDRAVRGFKLSRNLLNLGMRHLKNTCGSNLVVVADVFPDNKPSNACFSQSGFIKEASKTQRNANRWKKKII